jgi:hypothetical protein
MFIAIAEGERPRHRLSRPVIVVFEAHDVVLAELAAGLNLDQLQVDGRSSAGVNPHGLGRREAGHTGDIARPACG